MVGRVGQALDSTVTATELERPSETSANAKSVPPSPRGEKQAVRIALAPRTRQSSNTLPGGGIWKPEPNR